MLNDAFNSENDRPTLNDSLLDSNNRVEGSKNPISQIKSFFSLGERTNDNSKNTAPSPPPPSAFQQDMHRNRNNNTGHNDDDDDGNKVSEVHHVIQARFGFGEPYGLKYFQLFPFLVVLGLLTGISIVFFGFANVGLLALWAPKITPENFTERKYIVLLFLHCHGIEYFTLDDTYFIIYINKLYSLKEIYCMIYCVIYTCTCFSCVNLLYHITFTTGGDPKWILVTCTGGILIGLLNNFPNAPRLGRAPTLMEDIRVLKSNPIQAPFIICSTFLSLVSGASVGPELGLCTIGSAFGMIISGLTVKITNCPRTAQASLVLAGIGSALGTVCRSPLIAVLFVHEMSLVSRPSSLLKISSLVDMEHMSRRERNRQNSENQVDEVQNRDHSFSVPLNDTMNRPIRRNYSAFNLSSRGSLEGKREKGHDQLEQVSYVGTAATCGFLAYYGIMSSFEKGREFLQPKTDAASDISFDLLYIPYAILLGIICGIAGYIFFALRAATDLVKNLLEKQLERLFGRNSTLVGSFFFPLFACIIYGVIAVFYPITLGSGVLVFRETIKIGIDLYETDSFDSTYAWYFFMAFLMKLVCTTTTIGFGLIGGPIYPVLTAGKNIYTPTLLFIFNKLLLSFLRVLIILFVLLQNKGVFLGVSLPHVFPFLPPGPTIVCCAASICAAVCACPFTICVFVLIVTQCPIDMGTPLLMAVISTQLTCLGLGILQKAMDAIIEKHTPPSNHQTVDNTVSFPGEEGVAIGLDPLTNDNDDMSDITRDSNNAIL